MTELKPCPFCGGSVRPAQQRGEGFEIACHCGVSYSGMCASAEDLHRNWNRRAVLAQEPTQLAAPVGVVVLPEYTTREDFNDESMANGWNACLDKFEELNQ